MKKSLLTAMIFCVIMVFSLPMFAVLPDYSFQATTGTYTEISGGTVLGDGTSDDQRFVDPAAPLGGFTDTGAGFPIGFNFAFNDAVFDVIAVSNNGWITLGQSALGATAVNMATTSSYDPLSTSVVITPEQLTNRVAGLGTDIQAQAASSLRIETTGTAPNRVCVIQWKAYKKYGTGGTGDNLNFQIKLYETLNKVAIAYGAFTVNATAEITQVGVRGPAVTDFANRTTTTDWQATSAGAANDASCTLTGTVLPANGLIFTYSPPVAVPNDLQALSITGATGPAVNTSAQYTISVRNRGTSPQTTYSVKLMSGVTVLETVAGPTIQPNEILTVTINHTFTVAGPVTVFGQVVLAGDQNNLNDITGNLAVAVQAAGVQLVEIGTGTLLQRQPFGIWWGFERDASLYTSTEIGLAGALTAVKWYCGTTAAGAAPYRILIKTTQDAALVAAPWATMIADATLMQEGTYTFSTEGWVTFTFATPYSYTSSNLIVMVETNYAGTGVTPYPYFRYSTGPVGSHQNWSADTTAPTGNGTVNINRPNIGLFFVTDGFGALNGTITSGGTPLEGATVAVNGTQLSQVTGIAGTYNFPFVTEGAQQVTCTKVGYNTQTLPITIVESQTATLNFAMVSLPLVNVTGHVIGSDAPTVGVAGATIALTGMAPYSATTNASGDFTITGVFANQTYNYTVTKAGYSPATGTVTVGATNYNMGTVTVNEMAYPATGVQAVVAGNNVNVTWTAPNPNVQNFTDGFETYTDFAIDFAPWVNVDVDLSTTYGFNGFDFPGEYGAMSYMVFNPSTTVPASTDQVGAPHGGSKMLFCWAAETPPNNDWVISPEIAVPASGVVSFWARSQTADYGLERFKVGVSTTGTAPANFTIISGATYVSAPITWTQYTYQLTAYAGQSVKIGIECVSNDAFIFMVDDFFVGVPAPASKSYTEQPVVLSDINLGNPSAHAKIAYNGIATPRVKNNPTIEITTAYNPSVRDDRVLIGYKVWRLLEGQEANEAAWSVLTQNPITATAYSDTQFGTPAVTDGIYRWAVKAVYTGNVYSTPSLSNSIPKITQIGTLSGIVRNTSNVVIAGATVTAGTYTGTSNGTGAYSMQVPAGTYTVTCAAPGYTTGSQAGIVVVTGQTTTVNFNLAVSTLITDGFETYTDFAIDFAPWVNVDVDQSETYTITGVTFPGAAAAMSFIVFTPTATTPPITSETWALHGGNKFAACIAATTPPNNDWLISQQFTNIGTGATVSFWARTLVDTYGLERFKVGVSTGGTAPANFTFISGAAYVSAPIAWTLYTYDIPATYVGQNIRVGIQCVSNDAFVFMVDDFVMDLGLVANVDPTTPVVATALNGNFPNPFNPETTISYSVSGKQPVVVEIYNTKGQKVKTLVNETKGTGNYNVKWNGTDDNNHKVTSGVYFFKMNTGKYSSSKKMILMK